MILDIFVRTTLREMPPNCGGRGSIAQLVKWSKKLMSNFDSLKVLEFNPPLRIIYFTPKKNSAI